MGTLSNCERYNNHNEAPWRRQESEDEKVTEPYSAINVDQSNADEAYERVLPEAMALDQDALAIMNVEVPGAVITAMGALEKLPHYQADIEKLPNLETAQLAKFSDYVLALFSAQSRYTFAITPPEQLPELLEQATLRRDVLIAEAKALVARGALNGALLNELTGTHGYKNVAFDLSGLSQVFKAAWPSIQGKTGLQRSEIDETDKLALRLTAAVAHRECSPEAVAAATDIRQRMFTLVSDTYNQFRRAIGFLRWDHGDIDSIVPSLYAGRGNSNAKPKPTPEPVAPPVVTPPAPANPAPANKVPLGFPGSDPLTQA